MLVNDLELLFDQFGNSKGTKLLICTAIFVWCLQRHRNAGLNSGQNSAVIVTDALPLSSLFCHTSMRNNLVEWKVHVILDRGKDIYFCLTFTLVIS